MCFTLEKSHFHCNVGLLKGEDIGEANYLGKPPCWFPDYICHHKLCCHPFFSLPKIQASENTRDLLEGPMIDPLIKSLFPKDN